ncbi:MAG: HDOD domain-containing protein, partial [Desulfosarcina sp.]
MKTDQPIFDRLSTLKNLPTLPHILLKLFELCNQDSVNLDEIAAVVGKDPSLSTKILKLVNSAYFGLTQKVQDIGQAVILVGTSGIKNMAICACVYEAFPEPRKSGIFNLKAFWWHSLRCAFLSKNIATEIKCDPADAAFISGLLHDIGKMVLWVNWNAAYEEILADSKNDHESLMAGEARLGATHSQVGAWLLNRWNFQASVSDPVRYHHEDPARIAHALPLTQIIFVANLLAQDDESRTQQGFPLADTLLGLAPASCTALIGRSSQEARDVAEAMGIDVEVDQPTPDSADRKERDIHDALVRNVRNVSLLMGTLEGLLSAADRNSILSVIAEGLKIMLNVNRCLFFLADADKEVLYGYVQDQAGRYTKNHSLAVSMNMDQSLLVRAILEKEPLTSFDTMAPSPLTILDEQIVRLLGAEGIYGFPLIAQSETVGVLVLAIQKNDLPHFAENRSLLTLLVQKGALVLRLEELKRRRLQDIQAKRADASSDLAKKVVHEVNNPLSIIKNYLKILEIKLTGAHVARDEIRIINEEINRVADLLRQLTDFSTQKPPARETTDVNALIKDIVTLTGEALRRQSDVILQVDLDSHLPPVNVDSSGLKQVFINLIKNAVEAMASGGELVIQTRYLPPPLGSRGRQDKKEANGYVEIQIRDSGPGIPEAIKEKLFAPYVSSKEDGHFGLGLSIAYNIVKSNQGTIVCESVPGKGTCFKIELPARNDSSWMEGD